MCLHKSNSQYSGKPVKYFMLLTTARGLDWTDKELIESSLILFSCRDVEGIYNSLRQKYAKTQFELQTFFSFRSKKSMIYWLATFKQLYRLVRNYIDADNVLIVPLKALQKDSAPILEKICGFLHIDVHPAISGLTLVGEQIGGNASQATLNLGKIAKQASKVSFPLYSYEKRLFSSLGFFDYEQKKAEVSVYFSFIEMFWSAIMTAFVEIPKEHISRKAKLSFMHNIWGRLSIFINLNIAYMIFKDKQKPLRVLKKWDPTIQDMPFFWKEDV